MVVDPLEALSPRLHAEIATFVQEHPAPGVSAGVVIDRELVWASGQGFADIADAVTPDAATPFRVASITKTFTATALARLAEDGSLSLDDPLVRHLPELVAARNPFGPIEDVTIRNVLMHRSGLLAEPPLQDWTERHFPSIEETLGAPELVHVVVPPGSADKYSNLGFQLLGEVVARASGEPYRGYVTRRILEPLGLDRTGFEAPDGAATGYDHPRFTEEPPVSSGRNKPTDSEGGLWSTVEDLARWICFQFDGDPAVLSVDALRELHRPAVMNDDGWTSAQGLAWYHQRREDRIYVGHSGGTPGFSSRIAFSIPDRAGTIVLANGSAPAGDLALALGDLVITSCRANPAPPPARPPVPVPAEYHDHLGVYVWPDSDETLRIEWRGGALTLRWVGGVAPDPTLEAEGDPDAFVVRGGRETGERCRFVRDGDGAIVGVDLAGYPLQRLRPASA